MKQYYSKLVEAQSQDLPESKLYAHVDSLAIIDEGGRYHAEFDKEKASFRNYKIVGMGHSTSDLNGKENKDLTYLKIAMGRAVIKTAVESEDISSSNLAMVDLEFSESTTKDLHYGVLGCGNLGVNAIRLLTAQGRKVFYFDTKREKYTKFHDLIIAHPEKLVEANSQYDLFQISDVLLSCTGSDVTKNISYSKLTLRDNSPINKKVFFNFASGEKEFNHWLRQSQDKKNPRIINPRTKDFPEWDLTMADGHTLTIKFSGMPANMMKKGIHNLPKEKAQLIRAMKLAGIYQLDDLLKVMRRIPEQYLKKEYHPRNYIDLDADLQFFILNAYCADMIKENPRDAVIYEGILKGLPLSEIRKQSKCIPQMRLSDLHSLEAHDTLVHSIDKNDFYVARRKTIDKIDRCFSQPENNILTFCLYGIAGAGKTQIANHYYIENFQNYDIALYFYAEDHTSLPEQYKQKLEKYNNQKTFGNEQEVINDFIEWMENSTSFLLVYDNVENHKILKKMLPKMAKNNNGEHHILITSRTQSGLHYAEVPANMEKDEARELLEGLLQQGGYKGNDHVQIDVLTEELYHFPLAIAQAGAAIIDEENPVTITHYLKNFKENRESFLTSKKTLPWDSSAHESLYISWLMIKKKLSVSSLPWKYVLQIISVLPADKIAKSVIEEETIKLISLRQKKHKMPTEFIAYLSGILASAINIRAEPSTFFNNVFLTVSLTTSFLFTKNKLLERHEKKSTYDLEKNIHEVLKKLVSFGMISKVDVSHYSIHRLTQEMLLLELQSENLESTLSRMQAWTKEIDSMFNDNTFTQSDLERVASNSQYLLRLFGNPDLLKYHIRGDCVYTDEITVPIEVYRRKHDDGDIKGSEYYFDVFGKYLQFCLQLVRVLIYLKEYDQCKTILNNICLQLFDFYQKITISDKVIFFNYIQEMNLLIHQLNAHFNELSSQKISFNNDLLKMKNLPAISKKQIDRIPELESELENYIISQKKLLNTTSFFSYHSQSKIKKQIEAAEWLIDNSPIPSDVDTFGVAPHPYYFSKLECHREALNESKLNAIMTKYYPLVLNQYTEEMLRESTKWWLNQKNVKQESPFSCEIKPNSTPKI
ncbi:MAG: NB-ARC domain-containing protein [Pseudomonadota bacterium]